MYGVIDRSPRLAVASSRRIGKFLLLPMRLPKHEGGKASAKAMQEEKRLEDATASACERFITGYAETTCRRARMYAVPIGLSGGQYLADRDEKAR